ncbi:hypothetical protein CL633_00260 [bacterium]|nr:hypothetical protein [bacterium]
MHFLQSKEWKGFQERLGRRTFRIQGILIIAHNLIFGKTWLYVPKISQEQFRVLVNAHDKLRDLARAEKAIFLKVELDIESSKTISYEIMRFNFVKSRKQVQPKETLVLSLNQNKETILANMHKQTRYSINYAKRQGVKIRISNKNNKKQFKKDFQDFYKLLKNSSQKNKFKIHNKAYYFKFLQMQISELFIAEYKGRVLAGNVVVFYKQKAHGIHGANSADMRNLRAPYLMQWERILNAKKRHCKFYDFWGIGKKWPGITKFKKGFGGREVEYMNAYDIIFNIPWHVFYVFYTKINRFLKLCTGCN